MFNPSSPTVSHSTFQRSLPPSSPSLSFNHQSNAGDVLPTFIKPSARPSVKRAGLATPAPSSSSPIGKSKSSSIRILGSTKTVSTAEKKRKLTTTGKGDGIRRLKVKVTDGYVSPATSSPVQKRSETFLKGRRVLDREDEEEKEDEDGDKTEDPLSEIDLGSRPFSSSVSPAPVSPVPISRSASSLVSPSSFFAGSGNNPLKSRPSTRLTTERTLQVFPKEFLQCSLPVLHSSDSGSLSSVTQLILFGRTHQPSNPLNKPTLLSPSSSTRLDFSSFTSSSTPERYVFSLPRGSPHASRQHVLLSRSSQYPHLITLRILSRNGARINGKRVLQGNIVVCDLEKQGEVRVSEPEGKERILRKGKGGRQDCLRIGYWGGEVRVEIQSVNKQVQTDEEEALSSEIDSESEAESSALSSTSSDEAESEAEAECVRTPVRTRLPTRTPSPVFSPSPSPQKPSLPIPARPLEPSPVPAEVDLASLLSSALVFSRQTSLTLKDLTKAVLDGNPALVQLGSEQRWESWLESELESDGMWGRIVRVGKDASGHPLLDQFFYDPAKDADKTRAAELGSLMRPLRGTQRQGKTYFFKRPSTPGKKRR